jgi:hypothetical protein
METFATIGHTPQERQYRTFTTEHDDVSTRPSSYVQVPDRLLRSFAHDPMAIGVYLAVARCTLSLRGPAPLSPADLSAWFNGTRTRDAAILRRIRALVAAGWLVSDHGRAVKLQLLPTWTPAQPWDVAAPHLGKPRTVRVRRVPLELFDTYVGRIDPQPGRRPALVTRYIDRPLIGLVDLGLLALATLTTITPTARLLMLGLCDASGMPLPPPSLTAVLATVQAGQVFDDHGPVGLSTQGRFRCGEYPDPAPAPNRSCNGSCSGSRSGSRNGSQARSDAPSEPNGSRNGSRSGSRNGSRNGSRTAPLPERRSSPLECGTTEVATDTSAAPCILRSSWIEGSDPPPTPSSNHDTTGGGGGQDERIELLEAMGIRHTTGVADVPLALVRDWKAALDQPAYAARFRDPAGFAYAQLRDRRTPPKPKPTGWAQSPAGQRFIQPLPPGEYVPESEESILASLDEPTAILVKERMDRGMDVISAVIDAEKERTIQQREASEEVYRALRALATA